MDQYHWNRKYFDRNRNWKIKWNKNKSGTLLFNKLQEISNVRNEWHSTSRIWYNNFGSVCIDIKSNKDLVDKSVFYKVLALKH